ncbi:NAD(P)/FAD-dependent oxidoreductase [Conexibacter sp. DBS9H8]|uniref:NAD(P)/FAD-dependent oxidoreductase n=1 Tax=Conexibacter sp. DBS9H8 TaxID=2937801 RepID=UPI00200D8AAD|nr:FAD-dependent oxidoreductase [Conexibacter sp. DBS9H8]
MNEPTYVIVGGGLCGAKAAAQLRSNGADGRVVLVSEETELPYERPPLSKDLLQGTSTPADARVFDADFYAQEQIELLSGVTATRLDAGARRVELSDGREIAFAALLIATGAAPRPLAVPGAELDGVFTLRTLADAQALAGRLRAGGALAVIGGGWIGSEVAASARTLGMEVTVIDPAALPNAQRFGPEVAGFYAALHARHGVSQRFGVGVEAIEGGSQVTAVLTTDGERIEADTVVVGVGAAPRTELAEGAGITVADGILTDASLRTAAAGIFAAGDVALAHHPFYNTRVRVEHWANALHQGPAAARAMLGQSVSYDRLPFFFSDQFEVGMEYSGQPDPAAQVLIRGELARGEFIALWLLDGRLIAGMNVNVWDVSEPIQTLIRSRARLDVGPLLDPDTPLSAIAESVTAGSAG